MLERTLVVLAMLWLPAGLRAEEPGTLAVGSRVRVTSQETGAQPLIGQVVALEPGAAVGFGEGGTGQKRVPLVPSTTLEVSTGKNWRATRGGVVGGGGGAKL